MDEDKILKKLEFGLKWYVFHPEKEKERKLYINEAIQFWEKKGYVQKGYFNNPVMKGAIKAIIKLKPITHVMIDDFILGSILVPYEKHKNEANELLEPTMKVLTDYYSSDNVRNQLINDNVHKKDKVLINNWDIRNTRKALKDYIKDKPIIPFRKNIDELKLEYKHQQEKVYEKLQRDKTGKQLIGFKCPLDKKTVETIYLKLVRKELIDCELEDFMAVFSEEINEVNKPIVWRVKGQTNPGGRGNQTKLYFFLEKMLKRQPTSEDKRKAAMLFIDEKGKFFNPKMKKPKEEERLSYDIFDDLF